MIFGLFVAFSMNLILRLNDFIPEIRGFPLAEIMIPVLLVLWLMFEKKDFSLLPDLLLPGFFTLAILGYAIMVSGAGAYPIARSLVPFLAMYFLAANLVRTQKRMDWYLIALFATALVLVTHCVQQWMTYDGIDDLTGVGWSGESVYRGRVRYIGVMNDPNDLALFFVMMLPLALMLAVKPMNFRMRMLGYALCVPLLFGIFMTNSRGGILATGTVLCLYLWRRWGPVRAITVCGLLGVAALAFGPSRIRESDLGDVQSTQGRIDAWYTGFQLLRQSPVIGIGKDQFVENNPITAHNSFVLCFTETGLLGYVLWFGALFLALYGLHSASRRVKTDTPAYRQCVGLFNSLCAFCVGGFFLSRTYFIMLPVFLGLAMAQYRMVRDMLAAEETQLATHPNSVTSESSAFRPNITALPDLRWNRAMYWMPRLAFMALISILGIYVVVKLNI